MNKIVGVTRGTVPSTVTIAGPRAARCLSNSSSPYSQRECPQANGHAVGEFLAWRHDADVVSR